MLEKDGNNRYRQHCCTRSISFDIFCRTRMPNVTCMLKNRADFCTANILSRSQSLEFLDCSERYVDVVLVNLYLVSVWQWQWFTGNVRHEKDRPDRQTWKYHTWKWQDGSHDRKLTHQIATLSNNILLPVRSKALSKQDNVRTNTESVQCHHVFDTAYLAPTLRGHVTSPITWPIDSP